MRAAILVFLAGWKGLTAARRAAKELVANGMADVGRGLEWGWGRGLSLSHPEQESLFTRYDVPSQSYGSSTLFQCMHFRLFQYNCVVAGYVSENTLSRN